MTKIVCLDPGHNKRSRNRSPDGTYYEWEFNQDVVDRASRMIFHIPGLAAVRTKKADTYPTSLAGRVQVAHDAGAALFLSQHTNAYGSGDEWTSPNGFGVYRYPGRNLRLARIGLKWCIELLPMASRGIRERDFYVLRETRMPSIMFETGFHTNREDVAKLKTTGFRIQAARVLVRTACDFLEIYCEKEGQIVGADYHRVVEGDALYRIARDNDLSLEELLSFNPHIDNPDVIYAEHGGDMVFLEEPGEFELEHARLIRELILCKMQSSESEELANLREQLEDEKAAREALKAEKQEYRELGQQIHNLSRKFF